MTITFQCSRCGQSAPSERRLAEICPCNLMDRERPSLKLVALTFGLILLVVSPLYYLSTQIPN